MATRIATVPQALQRCDPVPTPALTWKAPRVRGFVTTGCPVRRHHRAASFDEWHYTTPDLRRLQFAAAALTGDTRTLARYLARCTSWYRIRSAAQL